MIIVEITFYFKKNLTSLIIIPHSYFKISSKAKARYTEVHSFNSLCDQ